MPMLTPVVVLLEIAEAAVCLDILRNTGRWKDYIAGSLCTPELFASTLSMQHVLSVVGRRCLVLESQPRFILKYLLLEVMIYLSEGTVGKKACRLLFQRGYCAVVAPEDEISWRCLEKAAVEACCARAVRGAVSASQSVGFRR